MTASPPREADVTIRTTPRVICDVLEARRPGYEAFLAGELEVRGSTSLALELESLFAPPQELSVGWPQTIHPKIGRVRWSILAAGPPDATRILLLHGLGGTKTSFIPTVKALSSRYRVLACDLPGFGGSSKPIAPYSAEWFSERVVELLDELHIDKAALIGNSMGGRIALEVGLRHPERCLALALLCPALGVTRFRQAAPLVRLLRAEVALLPWTPGRARVMRTIRSVFAHPERIPSAWLEAATDEFMRIWSKPRGRLAFFAAARSIYLDEPNGDKGLFARLAGLEVPTQFVFGGRDPLVPARFAGLVAAALTDARIAILDDCGHVPQIEEPERVHRLIRALLP